MCFWKSRISIHLTTLYPLPLRYIFRQFCWHRQWRYSPKSVYFRGKCIKIITWSVNFIVFWVFALSFESKIYKNSFFVMLFVFALSSESETCNRWKKQGLSWPLKPNQIINYLKNKIKHRSEVPGEVPNLII